MLVLTPILTACGLFGGDANTAEDFFKAIADGDEEKAKDNSCEDIHDSIPLIIENLSDDDKERLENVECETRDDKVYCTAENADGEEEESEIEMKDGKVCSFGN